MKKKRFLSINLWIYFTFVYFLGLLGVMWCFSIDLLQPKNTLLLFPIYGCIFVVSYLKHKNDCDNSKNRWFIVLLLVVVTMLVVLFNLLFNALR